MKTPALSSFTRSARRQIAGAAIALLAGAALAQAPATAPAPGNGPSASNPRMGHGAGMQGDMRSHMSGERHARGDGHDPAAMQARFDKHMAELKQSLQLTPAQEPAWTQFTSAMRPPAQPMARPDRAAMEAMTTPQRLERMQALRQQRQAEMDKHIAAVKTFYATLTPEQQKRFDAQSARHMRGHEGMHGGPGRHHG